MNKKHHDKKKKHVLIKEKKMSYKPLHQYSNNMQMRNQRGKSDQHFSFRYMVSTILPLHIPDYPKFQDSSLLQRLCRLICDRPGWKVSLLVFSNRKTHIIIKDFCNIEEHRHKTSPIEKKHDL